MLTSPPTSIRSAPVSGSCRASARARPASARASSRRRTTGTKPARTHIGERTCSLQARKSWSLAAFWSLDRSSNMTAEKTGAFIRNIAEVPWREFPNHFGGALSKPLVMPETAGSRHLDYRISMYQPMAHVARHKHKVQEQIYHVLEGEGLMEIAGKNHVVRKHDFIFLPPGVEHAISNSGLVDLVFLVVTSPVTDDEKPV